MAEWLDERLKPCHRVTLTFMGATLQPEVVVTGSNYNVSDLISHNLNNAYVSRMIRGA